MGNDITISLGEIVLDSSEGSDEVAYVDENGNQEIRPRDDNAFAGETMMTIVVPMPEDGAGDSAEGSLVQLIVNETTGVVERLMVM